MSEETRKVLEMLSSGKITVQEAERLLEAVTVPSADNRNGENKAEPNTSASSSTSRRARARRPRTSTSRCR